MTSSEGGSPLGIHTALPVRVPRLQGTKCQQQPLAGSHLNFPRGCTPASVPCSQTNHCSASSLDPQTQKSCHQLQQDRGGTSAITLGLTTTISEQTVGAVRKSFNFTNFGLQAVSSRNKGRTNWMTEWQEPENQHSPPSKF